MSGLLLSEETVSTAVGLVTALATDAIPGAVGAGVTLVDDRGGKTTSGASDPVVEKADSVQYELDEGPCLAAWAQRALVRLDEIGSGRRGAGGARGGGAAGVGGGGRAAPGGRRPARGGHK